MDRRKFLTNAGLGAAGAAGGGGPGGPRVLFLCLGGAVFFGVPW